MENRFNLVDEPWIPVADYGRVSLRQIFTNSDYRSLGGNPVQKIALLKLLLAVAQAAATPKDEVEWKAIGAKGLAEHCVAYLEKWHGRFYLYGDAPFLQMPAIRAAKIQPFGAVLPEVSTGNTTVLSEVQRQRDLDDGDKALLLLTLMGFALSGKKTDNSVVLTPAYSGKTNDKGKPATGKPGPSVAHMGLLHSFLYASDLQNTLWLNLLTSSQLEKMNIYPEGVGIAPWEEMPSGENCEKAQELKASLMGRLIPLSRFCYLTDEGLHYSEGIAHAGYKEGVVDPSMAINNSGKEPKALWVDPEKRPWRELSALLSFFDQGDSAGFQSWQIRSGLNRARDVVQSFAIWSGGLRVSSNAGEQYASGSDDFVESQVWLHGEAIGQGWFRQLKHEMDALDALAKNLYGRVQGFFKEQTVDGGKIAPQATQLFWQLCERDFQSLVNQCDQTEEAAAERIKLRHRFAGYVHQAYDKFCPRETARQMDAWAKCRPNTSKYLNQEG
ncbi:MULTISPECIES: type I-E CRISPR-associated protein Cse1/CasA [Idiomarina]|uniref:type I-E CRISPR-associated protein Cse1/CasA n=1 Tax=Idiomarina TaxID=135575 RepID=UPI00129C8667|nr:MULTISPECIES: type I-E CRISPR-associated protein Cse1/CasA [Idiomarina]MRJ43142.1 type I-E CRISPR-associated protein Cse1/CasA [Idiomarina sp. FeN1]NCU57154.1 type I-E CRISPR-associated protein Cse1/CasA [Idiomarina sp. FenA--70]NCU59863.1 type I-E CRISPR-associated protein Cse1/CasA [Idiomarina sp. FenBw--71]UUN13150.1 type I-E CRISPR-associated protein Cse1/CasA [Idiomarina loihiensis]